LPRFAALRTEIVSRMNTQAALMTLVVGAVGVVTGFVIKGGEGKGGGDIRLLLILPFLVAAAGIYSSTQDHGIRLAGAFIRDVIWPSLSTATPAPPSWEHVMKDFRDRRKHKRRVLHLAYEFLAGAPGVLIFGLGSLVPLAAVGWKGDLDGAGEWSIWVLGLIFVVSYAAVAYSTRVLDQPLDQLLTTPGVGNNSRSDDPAPTRETEDPPEFPGGEQSAG